MANRETNTDTGILVGDAYERVRLSEAFDDIVTITVHVVKFVMPVDLLFASNTFIIFAFLFWRSQLRQPFKVGRQAVKSGCCAVPYIV